jgi:hypothetical protein
MPVATIEAYIENGQIKLPPNAVVPEHGPIFIVIPDAKTLPPAFIRSPRLVNPAQTELLQKTMVEGRSAH